MSQYTIVYLGMSQYTTVYLNMSQYTTVYLSMSQYTSMTQYSVPLIPVIQMTGESCKSHLHSLPPPNTHTHTPALLVQQRQ